MDGYSIWNLNKQWIDKSMVGYLGDIKNDITQPKGGTMVSFNHIRSDCNTLLLEHLVVRPFSLVKS